jgi:hypothetical protein
MKALLFTFLITIAAFETNAQTITHDSAMVECAKEDSRRFKLNRSAWQQFKVHHFAYSSDHFKPTTLDARDTSMLTDSTYIKTFKMSAYKKTLHRRRTAGHYMLIAGSILGVLIIVGSMTYPLSGNWSNQ